MSRIRANTIVNGAGTGAPNFPRGAIISGISTINAEISVGTGTSISSPATNALALGTNDIERLRITSEGTVHTTMTGTAPIWLNGAIACKEKFSVFQGANFGEACFNIDVDNNQSFLSHNLYYYSGWKTKKGGHPSLQLEMGSNGFKFLTGSDGGDDGASVLSEKLRVSSGGIVTIPNQPAFHTSGNTATLVDSTNTVIVGNVVNVNIGNCYDSSNGRFTAPVDGIYQFSFWGLVYPHASDVVNTSYAKNGTQWADLVQGGADTNSHTSRAGSVIMSMSENDYAELRINRGTGSEQAYSTQWNMCGFLIG